MKQQILSVLTSIKFKAIKHGPTIAVVGGTAAIVTAGVIASKNTFTKAHKLIEDHKERLGEVKEAKEKFSEEEYSEDDYKMDLLTVYSHTALDFIKLYALPAALAVTGVVAILVGNKVLRGRYLATASALTGVQKTLIDYRNRVKEEVGEEKEYELYSLKRKEEIEENKKKAKDGKDDLEAQEGSINYKETSAAGYSPYSRIFDEYNKKWDKDPIMNQFFLKSRQNYWNDVLNSRRTNVVFLNEVLDDLGYDMTQEGAVTGWYKYAEHGDGYIDFGYQNDPSFMQGQDPSVILDFNVDPGLVHDNL